jgi:1,2-diacylglycerol 3-alpha-glucosyltransferase
MDSKGNKKIKIFMPCSGLGQVQRGFESFTRECFDVLISDSSLDLKLFKGAGASMKQEVTLWNLSRHDWLASQLGKLLGRSPYNMEQSTFFLSLLPYIYQENPDVVFFSDINLGYALWHWRRLTRKNYKLLFSNGSPADPPFPRCDHVQQLTPIHFQAALNAGVSAEMQSLIPYGFHISPELQVLSPEEKTTLRTKLALPVNRPLVLSAALIDKSHKRMDYLIREVANIPEPKPYLLLLGQMSSESSEVIALGKQLLGSENFQVRTVDRSEVENYYKIADMFVLPSLKEGLGRVLVEAMSNGLPCLVHNYDVAKHVLGEYGYFANFELEGSLTSLILQVLMEPRNHLLCCMRHKSVYNRFSWSQLRPHYIDMIQKCVKL